MKKLFLIAITLMLAVFCLSFAKAQELRVDFYDMGKADSMLITAPDGTRILIDAGTNKGGKALVERFAREGIDHIDVMIITHYDKDHVGGADQIIEDVGVGEIYMPVYDKESKQYEQFMEAVDEYGVKTHPIRTKESIRVPLENVEMTITAAHRTNYGHDEENDFSLCTRMVYGETRFLFPGDAEAPRQLELLEEGDLACDVLKAPYHGRLVSTSERFLAAAAPKIAFIPDGPDDPASDKVIEILRNLGTDVYCGKDGGIAVISDGKTVKVL